MNMLAVLGVSVSVISLTAALIGSFFRRWVNEQITKIEENEQAIEDNHKRLHDLEYQVVDLENLAVGSDLSDEDVGQFGEIHSKIEDIHEQTSQIEEDHEQTMEQLDSIQESQQDIVDSLDTIDDVSEFDATEVSD